MLQVMLVSLLHWVVELLQGAFQEPSSSTRGQWYHKFDRYDDPTHDDDDDDIGDDDNGFYSNNRQATAKLKEAYRFMELEQGHESTIEVVRRQWKRLSKRYHPDRNGGTQEAIELQQKLNESFHCIEESLSSSKSYNQDSPSDEETDEPTKQAEEAGNTEPTGTPSAHDEHPYQPPPQPQKQHQRQSTKKDKRKSRQPRHRNAKADRNRQRRSRRQASFYGESPEERAWRQEVERRQEAIRKQMEAELAQERKEYQSTLSKIRKEQVKIRKKKVPLPDFESRQAAHDRFELQVEDYLEQKKEDEATHANKDGFRLFPPPLKPENYVLESCTHDMVMAMKMGLEDFTVTLFEEEISTRASKKLHDRRFLYSLQHQDGKVSYERILQIVIIEILSQTLDEDHNTLLHYAVYLESPMVIQTICQLSRQYGYLEKVIESQNMHGLRAMDFAKIATNPTILPILESQQELVQAYIERTRVGPALRKAANELWLGAGKLHILSIANTTMSYLVARYVFQLHWLLAGFALILAIPRSVDQEDFTTLSHDDPTSRSGLFFTFLVGTKSLIWLAQNLWQESVVLQFMLILSPFFLLSCTQSTSNSDRLMYLISMLEKAVSLPLHFVEAKLSQPKSFRSILRRQPGLPQALILGGVLMLSWAIRSMCKLFLWI